MIQEKDKESMLPTIIAVDFDGTLVTNKFPEIGEIDELVWSTVLAAKNQGAKTILWTSRTDESLVQAVQFCKEHGLYFDAVNDNIPEVKNLGWNARKVFATYYIDDRMSVVFDGDIIPVGVVATKQQGSAWIPIAPESMPPIGEEVFLWELMSGANLEDGFLRRGYYDGSSFRYYNTDALCFGTVTHWTPFIQGPTSYEP